MRNIYKIFFEYVGYIVQDLNMHPMCQFTLILACSLSCCAVNVNAEIIRGEFCRSGVFTLRISKDQALVGNVMDTQYVAGTMTCLLKCTEHAQCQSVNYEEVQNPNDLQKCELNNANTKTSDSGALIVRSGYSYYELLKDVIDCSKAPCLNGGTCHCGDEEYGSKKSFCTCALGYEGIYCEKPKNYPKTCKDIQNIDNQLSDGEYELYLKWPECNQSVRIYCADMNNTTPLEYVTLPSGTTTNFAVAYNPEHAHRLEETKFEKIRLQVPEMNVLRGNFKFAVSNIPGVFHSYGAAADCFTSSCDAGTKRGRFEMDITGTSFRLPSSIPYSFISFPSCASNVFYPSMSADRLRWSGKCGGYCGSCWPTQLSLEIQGC